LEKSEAELRVAVEDLRKQEEEYNTKVATLKEKSTDPSASTVSKSKAAAELAQLLSEDPLPLRKAKITQGAALRKVEKERGIAEEAAKRVEESVRETELKLKEAAEYLEAVKNQGGSAQGAIWWMERELKEAQRYLPKKKQT